MIDPELRARAVRLVTEHRGEYPTTTAAVAAVAKQVTDRRLGGWHGDVGVDLGRAQVRVSEHGLDITDVGPGVDRPGGQGVAEHVTATVFEHPGPVDVGSG